MRDVLRRLLGYVLPPPRPRDAERDAQLAMHDRRLDALTDDQQETEARLDLLEWQARRQGRVRGDR